MNKQLLWFGLVIMTVFSACQYTNRERLSTVTPVPVMRTTLPVTTTVQLTTTAVPTTTPAPDNSGLDAHTPRQSYLTQIQADTDWARDTADGAPVRVAVIDTGIDPTHPDLAHQISAMIDIFAAPYMRDRQGHGTHTAGIIAALPNATMRTRGICHTCQIVAIKAINDDGYGSDVTVAQGINHAIDARALVINLSVGSSNDAPVIRTAIERAVAADIVVVAAAGNTTNTTEQGETTTFPAAYPGVIAVGAVDAKNQIAAFAHSGTAVDIVAPGVDILNTSPFGAGYSLEQGTSTAAPQVSATAALIRARRPDLSAQQTQELILAHAVDLGAPGYDAVFGHGLLNVDGVMRALSSPDVLQRGHIRGRVIGAESAQIRLQLDDEIITLDPNAQFSRTQLPAGSAKLIITIADQQTVVPLTLTGVGLFVVDINIWIRNGTITPEVREQLP